MDFGPFGLGEILFIGLLALVLFGPRRLPELARSLGSVLTSLRRGTEELKRSFQEELDSADGGLSRELKETGRSLEAARSDLRALGSEVVERGRRLVDGVKDRGPAAGAAPSSTGGPPEAASLPPAAPSDEASLPPAAPPDEDDER